MNETEDPTAATAQIDVRGPRFSATVTMIALAVAVILQGAIGDLLVAYVVVQFAVSTIAGVPKSPNARLFSLVRDRLEWGPAVETEPVAPVQFSQLAGLVFAGPALLAIGLGYLTLGYLLVLVVLALSGLLSLTGFCVGCELYIVLQRFRARSA